MTAALNNQIIEAFKEKNKKESRDYQISTADYIVDSILNNIRTNNVISPTGTGKTHISTLIATHSKIREALGVKGNRKVRILFFAHMSHLLYQASQTYEIVEGVEIILQSIFSPIPRDIIEQGWDMTFFDESHHEPTTSFQFQIPDIKNKPLVGFTASPNRGDKGLLKFENEKVAISREEAVRRRFIAETDLHSVMDFGGINKNEIVQLILSNFHTEMNKTIIFLRTRKEAAIINQFILEQTGRNSVYLSDSMTANECSHAIGQFSKGEVEFLVNCGKINEGVDVKGCDNVILAKEYLSEQELNQNIGRAARNDSDCNVWQLINPTANQLDARNIVGEPKSHRIIELYSNYCDFQYY